MFNDLKVLLGDLAPFEFVEELHRWSSSNWAYLGPPLYYRDKLLKFPTKGHFCKNSSLLE